MQQLLSVWNALTPQRRAIVALATVAIVVAVLLLGRLASAPGMALLYSGLDPAAAGDVVTALETRGVAHEVRGTAIYVDSTRRDSLRMELAAGGLPASGPSGYEILDGLSGFGTTSQMFDAAYWRAKEGELARTIISVPSIRAARVHIANPVSQPFRRDLTPTASVTVTAGAGGLTAETARALRHLVASAVPGLSAAEVSVIDSETGLVGTGDAGAAPAADSRAAELKENVQRLLEARVGRGRAMVEVSIEPVTDQEKIIERRFDPESRVAISTETEESTNTEQNTGPAAVTVASNLPDGDAAAEQNASRQGAETRERVNYEVSETQRELLRTPGAIRRLTVAVLVDQLRETGPDGEEILTPRSDTELAALEELVKSAVGFDAGRGDVVTIKTMAFSTGPAAGTLAAPGLLARLGLDVMSIVQLLVLAVVALLLGLFVLRPILTRPASGPLPELGPPLPDTDLPAGATPPEEDPVTAPDAVALIEEDPVARLRSLIAERQDDTAEILRSWIESREEQT
ncbi:flagellar basal-body MS-ring/collar protein FliF [Rhodovulum sp. YNF3179]|uniref:flagellar basal-body MS-ring/collar protein FliF n=1 Tax=Rhodovulum sp. YNF3179 TaxID=3425127 RepID=UPI003D34E4DF